MEYHPAYAVIRASGVFDRVEGDLCELFGMGVGVGERRIYRRMRATRARRRVVWQVLGDMNRLGWHIEKRLVVGWVALAELIK